MAQHLHLQFCSLELFFPPILSSILFCDISLNMHSLWPYPSLCLILKHCREGDRNYLSAESPEFICSVCVLVSTFCCPRADINHSTICGSTCCTLPTPQPHCLLPDARPQLLGSAHLSSAGTAQSSCVTLSMSFGWIRCHQYHSP